MPDHKKLNLIVDFKNKKCNTLNCSEYGTTMYANTQGVSRDKISADIAANAWYKKSKILSTGGKSIWEAENSTYGSIFNNSGSNLQIGDQVSFSNGKRPSSMPDKGVPQGSLKQENYARHNGTIIGVNKEGVPIVEHNISGTAKRQPINKVSNSYFTYKPLSITRPRFSFNREGKDLDKWNKLVQNDKTVYNNDFDSSLVSTYKADRKNIAIAYKIPLSKLDEIFTNILGIGAQETNLDNDIGDDFMSKSKQNLIKYLPTYSIAAIKTHKNIFNSVSNIFNSKQFLSNWEQEIKIKLLVKQGLEKEDAIKTVKEKYTSYKPNYNVTVSQGEFKQKQASKLWLQHFAKRDKELGFFESYLPNKLGKEWDDSKINRIRNVIGLYLENYKRAKKVYSNKTDKFYHDIAIQAHNAPSKAFNTKFTSNFIEKDDADYVNKVKLYVKKYFNP